MQTWLPRFVPVTLLLGASLVFQSAPAFAQAKGDPLLGTWVLNLSKSTFEGIAAPGKRTMTFTAQGAAIKHVIATVTAGPAGTVVAGSNEYTAKLDGTDVLIAGSFLDTVALKRIDARTIERTGKVMGMVVETMTWTVSADGKTLTVTTKGTNPTTEVAYTSLQVFDRQ